MSLAPKGKYMQLGYCRIEATLQGFSGGKFRTNNKNIFFTNNTFSVHIKDKKSFLKF